MIYHLLAYKSMSESKFMNCTSDEREKGSKPCALDLNTLGECYSNASDFKYGYDDEKPCIFFKMNRVSFCFLCEEVSTAIQLCKDTCKPNFYAMYSRTSANAPSCNRHQTAIPAIVFLQNSTFLPGCSG